MTFSSISSLHRKAWSCQADGHLSSSNKRLWGGFEGEGSCWRLSHFQPWNLLSTAQNLCKRLGWLGILLPESCLFIIFAEKIGDVIQTAQKKAINCSSCPNASQKHHFSLSLLFPSHPTPCHHHTYYFNYLPKVTILKACGGWLLGDLLSASALFFQYKEGTYNFPLCS